MRAAELGDATAELRTKEDFEKTIHLVETNPDPNPNPKPNQLTLILTLSLSLT